MTSPAKKLQLGVFAKSLGSLPGSEMGSPVDGSLNNSGNGQFSLDDSGGGGFRLGRGFNRPPAALERQPDDAEPQQEQQQPQYQHQQQLLEPGSPMLSQFAPISISGDEMQFGARPTGKMTLNNSAFMGQSIQSNSERVSDSATSTNPNGDQPTTPADGMLNHRGRIGFVEPQQQQQQQPIGALGITTMLPHPSTSTLPSEEGSAAHQSFSVTKLSEQSISVVDGAVLPVGLPGVSSDDDDQHPTHDLPQMLAPLGRSLGPDDVCDAVEIESQPGETRDDDLHGSKKREPGGQARYRISEVIPDFLYLSGSRAANNASRTARAGISAYLNVAAGEKLPYENYSQEDIASGDVLFKHVPMVDNGKTLLQSYFDECFVFIRQCLTEGRRVLVYCREGKSRSASIVIAYLIRFHEMNYDTALAMLRRVREAVDPNISFCSQLDSFSQSLQCAPGESGVLGVSGGHILHSPPMLGSPTGGIGIIRGMPTAAQVQQQQQQQNVQTFIPPAIAVPHQQHAAAVHTGDESPLTVDVTDLNGGMGSHQETPLHSKASTGSDISGGCGGGAGGIGLGLGLGVSSDSFALMMSPESLAAYAHGSTIDLAAARRAQLDSSGQLQDPDDNDDQHLHVPPPHFMRAGERTPSVSGDSLELTLRNGSTTKHPGDGQYDDEDRLTPIEGTPLDESRASEMNATMAYLHSPNGAS